MGEPLPTELVNRLHRSEAALATGDVGPRLDFWSHTDPVSLFAAVGPSKTGWAVLEPTFRSVAARLSGGHDVTYELVAGEMSGDVAWSAGIGRFVVSMDGQPPQPMVIRLTTAFRREAGDWRIVHEHSDFRPPEHHLEESAE